MTTRVVGYVRVSSEIQVDNYSLDAQRRSIRTACEYHGHELLTIYADEGRSAYSDHLNKRPALREAIDVVLAGDADAIMVDKLDRLARNARVFHDILHRLQNRVIFVKENIDPTTPTGELIAGILAQSAQFFSRNLATEVRKGKQERVRAGLWLGSLPFGYVKQANDDNGKFPPLIDDEPAFTLTNGITWSRADVARHVFEWAADGVTRRTITQQLTELGVSVASRGLINHMLPSRFYIGEIPVGRNNRSNGADAWLPGVHPPLIDREIFDAAQRHAQENRKGAGVVRKSVTVHPLSGLPRCGRCGSPMHCQSDHGKVRLQCSARHSANLCDQVSVLADRIEPQLLAALDAYAPPPDIAQRIAEVLEDASHNTEAEEREIAERQRRLREVYLSYGQMTDAEYRERSMQLDRHLQDLRARSNGGDQVRELAEMLRDLPGTYAEATPAQRNKLVRRVFREILIDNQEMVAVRVRSAIDSMLRARRTLETRELAGEHSSACQVPGSRDVADYLKPLPDGWWAIPALGTGMRSYPKVPRAWWSQIAEERAAGMSGPKLAERWGVKSSRTIYLVLEKYAQETRP